MKILRDNFPHKTSSSPVRKIGLLSIPVAVSMAMMYCGQQVNKILDERRDTTEEMSPDTSVAEKADITEGWNEAQENQVLMIYRIKKGDTLSSIARKHGVTLESILNINKKITSPDTIQIGQAILIPYDGDEEDQETVSPAIHPSNTASIAFSQASLVKIMRNVLTRPEGDMLGARGNQPSDRARLQTIAEKTGLGGDTKDVRYANLCAANMRAVSASLREYLETQGIGIDLSWRNGKNGIGVGKYFSDLKQQGKLPRGFDVIQTKSNPDATKLKQLLLSKGREYSIFVLSYSHDVDGHVNIAFRVGNDIIIFDPSWRGHSRGWPERFHKFEDYIHHFVEGETTAGYVQAKDRYNLYNITCVPTYKTDSLTRLTQQKSSPLPSPHTVGKQESRDDMRGLTMVFEGFSPTMHIDTNNKSATTYAIGYGTNIGTMQGTYPFGSFGKDVADYLKQHGHSLDSIKNIMQGKKSITKAEGKGLFEMRYVTRYQKIKKHCGKNWNTYPPLIRNMLVDMSYNLNGELGIFPNGAYSGFPDAVIALNRGDWVSFMNAIADSKYARDDVGPRRVGAWFKLIIRDLLHGRTTGLSQEARDILAHYTSKYKKDIDAQMAKTN